MDSGDNWMAVEKADPALRWPVLSTWSEAMSWLEIQTNLGLAPRTIEAYARGLADYFAVCDRDGVDPLTAERAELRRSPAKEGCQTTYSKAITTSAAAADRLHSGQKILSFDSSRRQARRCYGDVT